MKEPLPFDVIHDELYLETKALLDRVIFTLGWDRRMLNIWANVLKNKKPWWKFWL